MAPKAPKAPARAQGRAKKTTAANNGTKVSADSAIKKPGRPRKMPAADAARSAPKKRGRLPKDAASKTAAAVKKDAASKDTAAANASGFRSKGRKAPASAKAPSKVADTESASSARTAESAGRSMTNTQDPQSATAKTPAQPVRGAKGSDGYDAMNRDQLHKLANKYRKTARPLSESDTEKSLKKYLRSCDTRKRNAAAKAGGGSGPRSGPRSANAKEKKVSKAKAKGKAQGARTSPLLSTEERMAAIRRQEKVSRRALGLPDSTTRKSSSTRTESPEKDDTFNDAPAQNAGLGLLEQADAEEIDETDINDQAHTMAEQQADEDAEGGTTPAEVPKDSKALDTDKSKTMDTDKSWIGKSKEPRIDQLLVKGNSQDRAEEIAREEKEIMKREKKWDKGTAEYLKTPTGKKNLEDEVDWMSRRTMRDVGMPKFDFYQLNVVGDGLCAFRAFAMAFLGTDKIRSDNEDRVFEQAAVDDVRKHVKDWWDRIVDEANGNRGSPESMSRLHYYRAMNHAVLQDPELRRQANDWQDSLLGQSPTTMVDTRGESLAAQILQKGEKRVWAGMELMQVLADAFDVEVIIHTRSMGAKDSAGWDALSRGEFGARQVHVCHYQLSHHWTAATPVEVGAVWTSHLEYADLSLGTLLPYGRFPLHQDRYLEVTDKLPPRIPRKLRPALKGDRPRRIKIPAGWEKHRSVRSPEWADDAEPNESPGVTPTSTKLPPADQAKKRSSPAPDGKEGSPARKSKKSP